VEIPHIEDIDDLIHLGGNLGHPDVQPELENGASDLVEEPEPIVGVDFYDGKKIRALVVYDNLIRLLGQLSLYGFIGFPLLVECCGKG